MPRWRTEKNGVPQQFLLGLVILKIIYWWYTVWLTYSLTNSHIDILRSFVDICMINMLEGRNTIQRQLDRHERLACVNFTQFNKTNARSWTWVWIIWRKSTRQGQNGLRAALKGVFSSWTWIINERPQPRKATVPWTSSKEVWQGG